MFIWELIEAHEHGRSVRIPEKDLPRSGSKRKSTQWTERKRTSFLQIAHLAPFIEMTFFGLAFGAISQ
jgi:hypothetical protein